MKKIQHLFKIFLFFKNRNYSFIKNYFPLLNYSYKFYKIMIMSQSNILKPRRTILNDNPLSSFSNINDRSHSSAISMKNMKFSNFYDRFKTNKIIKPKKTGIIEIFAKFSKMFKRKVHKKRMSKILPMHRGTNYKFQSKNKPKNFLIIVYLVKKFIQITKTYAFLKKIFSLKNYHFQIINDKSNFYKKGLEFGEFMIEDIKNRAHYNSVNNYNYVNNNLFIFIL